MLKQKKFFVIFIISLFFNPTFTSAVSTEASLFLLPEKASYFDENHLFLNIIINPDENEINSFKLHFSFPSEMLELATSSNKSFCDIIIEEKIDNINGEYFIACGSPENIMNKKSRFEKLTFNKIKSGFAKIEFLEDSSLHANDGRGTNLLASGGVHNILITK